MIRYTQEDDQEYTTLCSILHWFTSYNNKYLRRQSTFLFDVLITRQM